jgi:pimeloyl-ACP methyl ester carboxylesterase
MAETAIEGRKIRYEIQGEGETLFLIHGYLETLEVWNELADLLSADYRVVRMDVPGHGKSDVMNGVHDMDLLAKAARQVLDRHQIDSCTLIGHSMGGYIALAFAEHYPKRLNRLCLFHSHPFADSEQVKGNRQQAIEQVRSGRKASIIRAHLPKTFADSNLEAFASKMEWLQTLALNIPEEGIIANLRGMMRRPDRSAMLKKFEKPFLLVAGKQDNFIDYNSIIPTIELPEKGRKVALAYSGHMGFIEEKEKSLDVIREFMENG